MGLTLKVRLIIDEGSGPYNMALDEALMYLHGLGYSPPTLRLYMFKPSTITLGYFQSVSDNVSEECLSKVPVVRRISGGGAVLHDEFGEITYSIVLRESQDLRDPLHSFKILTEGVVRAARFLGAPAEFAPLNDGIIAGKKFSGQAQARKLGVILQHGTFMYATRVELLAKCLKAPTEKFVGKGTTSILDRVTTISAYLGREVTRDEAVNSLIKGFSEALKLDLYEGTYSEAELTLAKSIEWKYRSVEWTYLRP